MNPLRVGLYACALALLAVSIRLVYGPATAGYDAAYAIYWGERLLHGKAAGFEAVFAPTPHPLTILEGGAVSVFGSHAFTAMGWVSILAMAGLVVAAFVLGRSVFSSAVGIAFAALTAATPVFIAATLQSVLDVQFLLFMVLAALCAYGTARGEYPRRAALFIAIGGLLRPEAWAIGALYVFWLWSRRGFSRSWVQAATMIVAAPAVWVILDTAVTGNPLHSLHGTQTLAEELGRYRDGMTALKAGPAYLRSILGPDLLLIALAGIVIGLRWWREATVWFAAVLALGVGSFLVLGLAGLPLIIRYLSVPAAVLLLFASVGLAGWISLPRDIPDRLRLAAIAGIGLVILLIGLPARINSIEAARTRANLTAAAQPSVHDIARSLRSTGECAPVLLTNFNIAPQLARELGTDVRDFEMFRGPRFANSGTVVLFAPNGATVAGLSDAGFKEVERVRALAVWTRCERTEPRATGV